MDRDGGIWLVDNVQHIIFRTRRAEVKDEPLYDEEEHY